MELAKACLEKAIEALRKSEQFAMTNEKAKAIEKVRREIETQLKDLCMI